LQLLLPLLLQQGWQRPSVGLLHSHSAAACCPSQQLRHLSCQQQQKALQQAMLLLQGPLQSLQLDPPDHRCCCACQPLLLPLLQQLPSLLLHPDQHSGHPMWRHQSQPSAADVAAAAAADGQRSCLNCQHLCCCLHCSAVAAYPLLQHQPY
jgi:hypothetical protein